MKVFELMERLSHCAAGAELMLDMENSDSTFPLVEITGDNDDSDIIYLRDYESIA